MSALNWSKAEQRAASALQRSQGKTGRRKGWEPRSIFGGDCPKCASQTVQRKRKRDGHLFFGCRAYPACDGVWKPLPVT